MQYIPRLTSPSYDNKNYIYYQNGGYNYCIKITSNGSCLPNCVGYAWGRFRELLDKYPNLSRGNAERWWTYNDGYQRGSTPKLGAVICFRKGSERNDNDGAGHVGIVEKINEDGSITVSNSAYHGSRFYLVTIRYPYNIGTNYHFQGFIYNPNNYDENDNIIKVIQRTLNERYGYNLAVDGSPGPDTRKHMIMALQTEFNKQYGTNLDIDGSFGPKTKRACPDICQGCKGNITWLIQAMLIIKGYNLQLDSSYGPDTKSKIKAFQRANGLKVDGICGRNTFAKLFK